MLELIFQGFMEWAYGLALECWEYFSSSLLDIMSMDYAYMKSHVPVMVSIAQVLLAVGWALLIGNLVFQALKSMAVGLGFEGEDPKLLFTRTFVFAFLLMASPQICEVGLSLTARIIELLEIPDAINVTLVDEGVFGSLGAAWLLVIIFGLIIMLKVFRLLLEIAERYVILAVLTMTAPLAFAMGGSKSTSEIFGGWCRMFGSITNSFTVLTDTKEMREALSSVLSVAPDDRVNLAFEDQKLVFRCSSDWGNASAGIDVIALTGSPTDSYWYSAKQLATCLKALGGTITLGIAQGGMLTISTQDAYYLQNVMRAPAAKEKSKKAIEPPAAKAA